MKRIKKAQNLVEVLRNTDPQNASELREYYKLFQQTIKAIKRAFQCNESRAIELLTII